MKKIKINTKKARREPTPCPGSKHGAVGKPLDRNIPGAFGQAAAMKGRFVPGLGGTVAPADFAPAADGEAVLGRSARSAGTGAGGTGPALARRQRFDGTEERGKEPPLPPSPPAHHPGQV